MKTVTVKLICDQCGKEATTTETDQITLPEKWYDKKAKIPDSVLKIPNWYQAGYKDQLSGEIVMDFCSNECLKAFMKEKAIEQVELDRAKKEQEK